MTPRNLIKETIVAGMLGLAIGVAVSAYAVHLLGPSVTVNSVNIAEGSPTGNDLKIDFDVVWREACTAIVDSFILSTDGDVIRRRANNPVAYQGPGHFQWTAHVDLPKELPRGNYVYRIRLTSHCPSGQYPIAVPDLPFKKE
jgi:hypothetical protein